MTMKAFISLRNFANRCCALWQKSPRLRKWKWFFLLCLGLLAAIPFTFPKIGFLSYFLYIPFLTLLLWECRNAVKLRQIYKDGLWFFWGWHIGGFYWFYAMHPLDFLGLEGFLSLLFIAIAAILLPLFLSLFYGFLGVFTALLARHKPLSRIPLLHPVAFAAIFTLGYFLQTKSRIVIPFVTPAITQTEFLPLAQSASLFGAHFLNFLILAVGGLLAHFILSIAALPIEAKRPRLLPLVLSFSLLFGNLLVGGILTLLPQEPEGKVLGAAIQENVSPLDQTFLTQNDIFLLHKGLTEEAVAKGAELVLWSETSVNLVIWEGSYYYGRLQSLAKELNITLATGSRCHADHNALFVFYPDGSVDETVYLKQYLVPFGEYVPAQDFIMACFPFMAKIAQFNQMLVPGEECSVFKDGDFPMGGMICFDSIYPQTARGAARNGAELLLLPTSDAWFQDTAATKMHLSHASLRAIETGKWILRAGHTGISAVINEKGKVTARLDPLLEGYVLSEVEIHPSLTLYDYIGDLFVLLCALFVGGCALTPSACKIWTRLRHRGENT